MATGRMRGLPPPQELDIRQIIQEAQVRWLKPPEVCEILRNYQTYGFQLNPVPPVKPPSGSLFLFDRKALRYFRKDGHNWRKKKDGKTVREAHERLKAGSIDVLHCYYAHGEDDQNFQRRSYWMLEGSYEHIVLVHYLQVQQSYRANSYKPPPVPAPENNTTMSPEITVSSSELDDVDSSDDVEEIAPPMQEIKPQPSLLHQLSKDWSSIFAEVSSDPFTLQQSGQDDFDDLMNNPDKYLGPKPLTPAVSVDTSMWNEMLLSYHSTQPNASSSNGVKQEFSWQQTFEQCTTPATRDALLGQVSPMKFEGSKNSVLPSPSPQTNPGPKAIMEVLSPRGLGREPQTALEAQLRAATEQNALRSVNSPTKQRWQESTFPHNVDMGRASQQTGTQQSSWIGTQQETPPWQKQQYMVDTNSASENVLITHGNPGDGFKKIDSFGRWVTQELGDYSPGALPALPEPVMSDSGSFWIPDENSTAETPSLSSQMQLEMSISISPVQRFSITDFSPDWSFANEDAKVLVSGRLLDNESNYLDVNWCCMFGDVEVPAELINIGVLRCKVPARSPGRVPFYVTCSDRLACSEVREFEIRPKQEDVPAQERIVKELLLELRFAKMLLTDATNEVSDEEWQSIESGIKDHSLGQLAVKEKLLEFSFKCNLRKWLSTRENASYHDEHGQGLLHLSSALGFDWAITPILDAGVVPNFRDSRGWTALHWAATFGREKTINTLLAAGTSPSFVTDPTPKYPNGQMASELASAGGHKGIAGYLDEKALTSHLSSLTIADNSLSEISSVSAALEGENAARSFAQTRGQADALSAVRNATTAAALIHSAYRLDSFRKRSNAEGVPDEYGMLPDEIQTMVAAQRAHRGHREQSAALHIQRKFRGWKGRKAFLNLRKHVVRIQAHVRGHQVRKQFKKVLWVVGVIEKAVLRWRRKRVGLRGFRPELQKPDKANCVSSDDEDFLREGRKQKEIALEKAVTRVQSMARSEEAREQYGRMVEGSRLAAAADKDLANDQFMTLADD